KLITFGAITLGAMGAGLAINSFLPQRFPTAPWHEGRGVINYARTPTLDTSSFPQIDVAFLRCGSVAIPEAVAIRGTFSLAPILISYSAVLVRHPKATFLYDTGFCSNIHTYILDQPLFFRKTLGNFQFERALSSHLKNAGIG